MEHLIAYGVLAPPNLFIVLCLLGALLALAWQRTGAIIASVSSFCLFVAATPAFSSCLLVWLEADLPRDADLTSAQAIVVPYADSSVSYGAVVDRPGPQSLERLVFAVDAYKALHLPVLVTGGPAPNQATTGAEIMKVMLERYFAVPVSWVEDRSETTHENAAYTAQLLQKANIHTVIVVTQARDTPRALWSFKQAGLQALAWPSPRDQLQLDEATDFLPNTRALQRTFYALHELIGGLYYRIRYQTSSA